LALEYLRAGHESDIFNLGTGEGFSVKEIIDISRKITGHPIPVEIGPRRAGDPSVLVASADKAKSILGWAPRYSNVERVITDAWRWHKGHPEGYGNS
jgi:UDP-glucose 4-epimerase